MKYLQQFSESLHPLLSPLVAHFVASTPQNNRRMIAITLNEIADITLVPLVKVITVAVRPDLSFGNLPFVEGLIQHQKTHAITKIKEFCRPGIVARANGVAAHLSKNFQPPLPDSLGHCSPHTPAVVVKANTMQLDTLAVQQKPLISVEDSSADSDGCLALVDESLLLPDSAANPV